MVVCICPRCRFHLTCFKICFMQVKVSDSLTYYSCDDHFPPVERTNGYDEGMGHFHDRSLNNNNNNLANVSHEAQSSEGDY